MSITPKAIQDLLDELEASKQSRLRAWDVLQRLPLVLSKVGNVQIPSPSQKTLDAEGEILGHALLKSLRIRNEAIKSLCSSVRRFRDATIKEECKSDYPHAFRALWKELVRSGGRFDSEDPLFGRYDELLQSESLRPLTDIRLGHADPSMSFNV